MSGWLLFAFGVPTNLVALCHRSGLRATRKKPQNFYRKFDGVPAERDEARRVVGALKASGLQTKWLAIAEAETPSPTPTNPPPLRLAPPYEGQRQAETLLQRDAYARAKDAVRRSRGDRPGDYSRRRDPLAP